MTNPITPPPELSDERVGEWLIDDGYPWEPSEQAVITITTGRLKNVACKAFQAGADQELEACCELMDDWGLEASDLRVARRPKPPSLKEQALALIDDCTDPQGDYLDDNALSIIRRALEALPE